MTDILQIDWAEARSILREAYELGKKQLNLTLRNGAKILKQGGKDALEAANWARNTYHEVVLELDRNLVDFERFKKNVQRINETLETMLKKIANETAKGILAAIIDGVTMLANAVVGIIKPA